MAGGHHAGRTDELAGDAACRLADFVAAVAASSGKPLPYRNMTPEGDRTAPLGAGVPETFALILSDTDAGAAQGALFDNGGDLARPIGRPATPFRTTVAAFFQTLQATAFATVTRLTRVVTA